VRASDRAHALLRSEIVDGLLAPGSVLAEVEQSSRLGVSRTPLREAIARLVAEGLANPHGGRGVVVSAISLQDVGALFEVRTPLECAAVRLAAARGPAQPFVALAAEFRAAVHLITSDDGGQGGYYALAARLDAAIDAAAANPYLLQAQTPLRTQLLRVRRLARDHRERLLASAGEHEQIARALGLGLPDLAEAAMRVHLLNSLQHLRSEAGRRPSPPPAAVPTDSPHHHPREEPHG
jgi:DNA-binding GntR family transcriptional regulator